MKFLVVFFVICVVVSAEPPRRQFQRQHLEQAPYNPSGFRPSQEFRLPARLVQPATKYGLPAPSYGPPPADLNPEQAGSDDQSTSEQSSTTTEAITEEPDNETEPPVQRLRNAAKLVNGKEVDVEEIDVQADDSKKVSQEQPQQENFYYIILPTGQLQKVQYVAEADIPTAAYTSSYQYQYQSSAPFSSFYYVGNNAPLVLV